LDLEASAGSGAPLVVAVVEVVPVELGFVVVEVKVRHVVRLVAGAAFDCQFSSFATEDRVLLLLFIYSFFCILSAGSLNTRLKNEQAASKSF